ncbi:hypothetical protein NDU88_005259 [Pleurodeles waltl]|uniref:Uncharacterized protein n=1 Tax=Pleurodeles waltl TaxID=8319 RepID=A0AAV7PM47_PLEWA|nr:hypothetical protein NDU88_005259 [Pleurodeles waltl]
MFPRGAWPDRQDGRRVKLSLGSGPINNPAITAPPGTGDCHRHRRRDGDPAGRPAVQLGGHRGALQLNQKPGGSARPGRDWWSESGPETLAREQEGCGKPRDKENTAPPGTCRGPTERRRALPSTNTEDGDGPNGNGPRHAEDRSAVLEVGGLR